MGKIFGALLIVAMLWLGLTVFSEGTDAIFGGPFASSGEEAANASDRPLPRRVEESVRKTSREHEERTVSHAEE